jgi:DNA-binding GntR family transcriptional regulator
LKTLSQDYYLNFHDWHEDQGEITVSGHNGAVSNQNEGVPSYLSDITGLDNSDSVAITRRQLHNELLTRLREFIITGKIKDGAKIPEKELCDYFGISRTPLREALKVMAFEGLISLTHNRGATVRPITVNDLREVFPIYAHLEALAGQLACKRLTKEEIDDLLLMHDELVILGDNYEYREYIAKDELVHMRIETASSNPVLLRMLQVVSGRVRRVRYAVPAPKKRQKEALEEHGRIMSALRKRDSDSLSQEMKLHICNSFRFFEDSLTAPAL